MRNLSILTFAILVAIGPPGLAQAGPEPPPPPVAAEEGGHGGGEFDLLGHLANGPTLHFPFTHWQLQLPRLPKIDLSVTRVVVMMWVAAILTYLSLRSVARGNFRRPRGFGNAFEAVVLFVRDHMVIGNMGREGLVYLPFLATLFLFILYCNLLGLVPPPFGQTATGDIQVTGALAAMALVMIHYAGIRQHGLGHHLRNIVPPVPLWLWPLMLVVELIGILAKPFALCIRLFANMTAGHCVLLGFMMLIFLAGGSTLPLWLGKVPISIGACLFMLAVLCLELFVAFLQAYIFVYLTSIFMGQTIHVHH